MFQSRLRSEDEARSSRPTYNRLIASSLLDLLEERKHVTTQKELEDLAKKYGIDLEKLQRLASHVNSVSVDQNTVKRWVGEDGAEHVTMIVSVLSCSTFDTRCKLDVLQASWASLRIEAEKPATKST